MFWLLLFLFCALDVYSLTFNLQQELYATLAQVQLVIACVCGAMVAIRPNPKRKSAILILLLGSVFVLITQILTINIPDIVYWLGIIVYSFGITWAGCRPYEFLSDELTKDTVCLVFYKANSGSWLMHVLSIFGLPVSSMSIIADDRWLKLVVGEPALQLERAIEFEPSRYVVIDTGVKITDEIIRRLWECRGRSAISKNSLFLRVRCIAIIKDFLKSLGPEWNPGFIKLPSIYFYKAVHNRQQRKI